MRTEMRFIKNICLLSVFLLILSACGNFSGSANGNSYKAGNYEGTALLQDGKQIKAIVMVSSSKIDNIQFEIEGDASSQSAAYVNQIKKQILENQSLDVDVVSGASQKPDAVLETVSKALDQARQ